MSLNLFHRNHDQPKVEITVSNKTIIRILLMIMLWLLLLSAIRQAANAIFLIGTAFFLALAFNSPVQWIGRKIPGRFRGHRTAATAVSYLLVVLIFAAFIASFVPPLVRQTGDFIDSVPGLIDDLRSSDNSLGRFVDKYNLHGQIDDFSEQLSGRMKNIGGDLVGAITSLTNGLFAGLTVLVMTFMMLVEGPYWTKSLLRRVPEEMAPRVSAIGGQMYGVIKGFVNGQVLLAAVAAVMILIPLLVLGVDYPFALMVIVFFCGLIPMIGHYIGATIVTLVALFQSVTAAMIILAYYILYQQIENYIFQPKIQSNTTDMSPLLVFMSVIIGVNFGGLLGGLVAIPVAGCTRILLLEYLNSKKADSQS